MRALFICILIFAISISNASAQATLNKAKDLFNEGKYEEALPLFESEYNLKPTNASISHWYGVCLFETQQNLDKAEEYLLAASKRRIRDSFLYLGKMYSQQYRFSEATNMYSQYEKHLKKNGEEKEKAYLEQERKENSRMHRIVSHTEDIQIIDSLVIDKTSFLSAYHMSISTGKLDYFNNVFSNSKYIPSTVYFNEKETKIYYAHQENDTSQFELYTMEKLLDGYKNEKKLSLNNFGLSGNINYPFLMADGVTIYFAAEDQQGLGGYDIYVSRYNMNSDTYLNPERLNMPFNSTANDYMMVVDEEKGIGWFATDRAQTEHKVCIYTFIPNATVRIIDNDDEQSAANRAKITSIKDSWLEGQNYAQYIALARREAVKEEVVKHDFIFVVNDNLTYYSLDDFKSQPGYETYNRAMQLNAELRMISDQLEQDRSIYTKANNEDKIRINSTILEREKRQEFLQKEIPNLEMQARNYEIVFTKQQ